MGFSAFTYELYMLIADDKLNNKKHEATKEIHYTIYAFASISGFLCMLGIFKLSELLDQPKHQI
jgi:hypothetical protein